MAYKKNLSKEKISLEKVTDELIKIEFKIKNEMIIVLSVYMRGKKKKTISEWQKLL